jgi:hypothetical protein
MGRNLELRDLAGVKVGSLSLPRTARVSFAFVGFNGAVALVESAVPNSYFVVSKTESVHLRLDEIGAPTGIQLSRSMAAVTASFGFALIDVSSGMECKQVVFDDPNWESISTDIRLWGEHLLVLVVTYDRDGDVHELFMYNTMGELQAKFPIPLEPSEKSEICRFTFADRDSDRLRLIGGWAYGRSGTPPVEQLRLVETDASFASWDFTTVKLNEPVSRQSRLPGDVCHFKAIASGQELLIATPNEVVDGHGSQLLKAHLYAHTLHRSGDGFVVVSAPDVLPTRTEFSAHFS